MLAGLTSPEISFKRCAACSAAFYCSVECQRAAWKARPTGKGHKQICFQQALSQEEQTAARAAPDLVSLSTAFNKYLTSVQAPLRSM